MATLTDERIEALLVPYLDGPLCWSVDPTKSGLRSSPPAVDRDSVYSSLSRYLDLLLKWNARTNLTAVREPAEIVTRHFGESLFAARCVAGVIDEGSVLDFGSGAGFPGIPLQMYFPALSVTLAESQGKKAAFLRVAVRELGLSSAVWGSRVSEMASAASFDLVTTRAVDDPLKARAEAWGRVRPSGWLLEMTTAAQSQEGGAGFACAIPGSRNGVVALKQKV